MLSVLRTGLLTSIAVQNSRFLDLPSRRTGKTMPPVILDTISPSYIVASRDINLPAPESDIISRQDSIPVLNQRQGSYATIVRELPKNKTTPLVPSPTIEPQPGNGTLVEETIQKFDSPQKANTPPISKSLSRTSTLKKADSPQSANTARRSNTAQNAILLVPNRSRPLIPPHLLKQPTPKPAQEEIQRLSLANLFQDGTADYPRSSCSHQRPRDAGDSDGAWSQKITDEVNDHMRPTNVVRSWNIAGRDPNDQRYNAITEADWNMFQFRKDEKKEKK